jgi:hypothetical protein
MAQVALQHQVLQYVESVARKLEELAAKPAILDLNTCDGDQDQDVTSSIVGETQLGNSSSSGQIVSFVSCLAPSAPNPDKPMFRIQIR